MVVQFCIQINTLYDGTCALNELSYQLCSAIRQEHDTDHSPIHAVIFMAADKTYVFIYFFLVDKTRIEDPSNIVVGVTWTNKKARVWMENCANTLYFLGQYNWFRVIQRRVTLYE